MRTEGLIRRKVWRALFLAMLAIWVPSNSGSIVHHIQYNLNGSNTDGSFTVDDSNSFFSPYKILRIAQENKYLGIFFLFYHRIVCCVFSLESPHRAGLGGSVGCAVRLETRRSRVQPPPRSATFFRGDWSWNIFYGHSLPSADSRRAVVSFWRKNVHNTG